MDDLMDRQSEPVDPLEEGRSLAPVGDLTAPAGPPDTPIAVPPVHDRPSSGLTRVPIDPGLLVDEQSAAWCRHEVRRIVAWHLVGTGAAVFAVLVPLLWWALGDPLLAGLLALVGAGLVTAGRLGFALAAAPLGYRYVQRFSSAPPEYLLAHPSIVETSVPGGLAPPSLPPPAPPVPPAPSVPPAPPVPSLSPPTAGAYGDGPPDVWDLDPDPDLYPDLDPDLDTEPSLPTVPPTIGLPDPASAITTEMSAQAAPPPLPDNSDLPGLPGSPGLPGLPALTSGPLVDLDGTPVPERHTQTADVLRELGFTPVATLRTEGLGGRYIDLYGDRDRVVVAVDRTTATTTVLTELAGFRVLVTSALLVPPTDELVVNVVADGDPAGLVLSHQRLVQQAFRSRTRVSEPVGLFKLAQQRELEAYRELGPLWGAVLDLRCRSRGVRLLAAPSAGDVLLFTGNRLFQQTSRERAS